MKKVAVTGGIGSGKSYVCDILISKGYPVFNSDQRAKELMLWDTRLKRSIEELIGKQAYRLDEDQNIQINHSFIAAKIFEQVDVRLALEQLVHPAVRSAFEEWVSLQKSELVFQESALILGTDYYKNFEAIVLVSSPKELQISRVMQRDHVDRATVLNRMNAQPDFESLLHLVTHIIDNSGSLSVVDQIDALILDLLDYSDL